MSVLNVNQQKQSKSIFYRRYLSYQGVINFFFKTQCTENMQIHDTIVKYWVQNTYDTKWFWYDMTIIPEYILKHMINREKYYREEFKILWQRNIEFPSEFHLLLEMGLMQNIWLQNIDPLPFLITNEEGVQQFMTPLICNFLYWPPSHLNFIHTHIFYQLTDSGF